MMTNDLKYGLIDKYLSGNLSKEDQMVFDQLMLNDSDFAGDVKDFEAAEDIVIDEELLQLKSKISTDLSKRRKYRRIRKIALGTILTGVVLIFLLLEPNDEQVPTTNSNESTNNNTVVDFKKKDVVVKNDADSSPYERKSPSINSNSSKTNNTDEPLLEIDGKNSVPENNDVNVNKDEIVEESAIQQNNDERNSNPMILPCDTSNIIIQFTNITSTCEGENKGVVKVKASGGTLPYQYSIDGGLTYDKGEEINSLSAGTYGLVVQDNNNCVSDLKQVKISSKPCRVSTSYVFNSSYETWKIPSSESSFHITIKNQSGNIVFDKQYIDVVKATWNGHGNGNNEEILEQGFYIFVIKYDNGTYEKGHVTIIR